MRSSFLKLPFSVFILVQSVLFCSFPAWTSGAHAAKTIEIQGGNPGQGFAPLAEDAGSINIGGGEVTVQDVTFSRDPETSGPAKGGTFKTEQMTASALAFGDHPNANDLNMASLLQEFRFMNHGVADFADPESYLEYRFSHLKPGTEYQIDLFTAADSDPRNTRVQLIGDNILNDTFLTKLKPQIVQFTLKPNSSGEITVRYGFGGGAGDAGILNAIAITTNASLQNPSFSLDKTTGTVRVTTSRNTISLQAWSEGTLRITAAPGSLLPQKKSLAVITSAHPAGWEMSEEHQKIRLKSKKLSVSIEKISGLISFYGADGRLLLQQKSWSFKPAPQPERDGIKARASFLHPADERFFGGGVIGDDFRKPSAEIRMQNDYLQMHIPILYSSRGYGFFWDSPDRSVLKISPEETSWESAAGDLADFYFMAGPEADTVIAEYRFLTGAAPLLPKWAYGFWFSKNKFDNQQQITEAAKNFRERKIPIDLLVQDYFYWKPSDAKADFVNWGSHEFVSDRYPDPKKMIEELHNSDHIQFMAVIWAKFDVENTDHGKELLKAGGLLPVHNDGFGKALRYYDPYDPNARQIYGRQVMDSLLSLGLDGFWMDGAEPEMNMDTLATFQTAAGPASKIMSAYPLMHTQSIYDAQRAVTQDKRVVLLPRSAWAGAQRNSVVSWTSDIDQTWKSLIWQIEGLQNYSITGLPYITTDVGGYNPRPEADRELFVRWFQWGTFCPVFRVHGVGRPFPWEYGTEGDAIFKKFDNLRYSILPYVYSEASRITMANGTLLRPLVMDFRDDLKAVGTWDEFLFGPSLLVCPVYKSNRESVASLDQFSDAQGKPSFLTASFLKSDGDTTVSRKVKAGFEIEDGPEEDRKGSQGVRLNGTFTPKESGPLALEMSEPHPEGYPVVATIDGKPVSSAPLNGDWQFPLFPFEAEAGVPVPFSLEGKMSNPGFRVVRILGPVDRDVYLPGKADWFDFWTGETLKGGQTLKVPTPLDMIPLYVSSGSILPLSPGFQYAAESPEKALELRVYRGRNGTFSLYQDQGNNYGYEKGAYSLISISWDEEKQQLTFGARKGSYPGMPSSQKFRIVWVSPGHGVGENETVNADKEIVYEGKEMTIPIVKTTP